MSTIRLKDFENWLKAYGDAWEQGDVSAARHLFTHDVMYYETPFADPITGLDQISKYWKDNAALDQKEIRFSYEVLAVHKNVGVAHWRADFIRLSSGKRVKLDGIFKIAFSDEDKCQIFREWWHRLEETPSD